MPQVYLGQSPKATVLRLARSELDIVDALLLAQAALGDHQILTFDRKLSKMIDRAKTG